MPDQPLEQWVLCPTCARRLCKKIGTGTWETVMVQRRGKDKKTLRVVIRQGHIQCPTCETIVPSTQFHRNEHMLGGFENGR